MSDTITRLVIETADDTTLTHFTCCQFDEGEPTRTHCGLPDAWDGELADHVDCAVCDEIENAGGCGVYGTCPNWEPQS